MRCPRVARGTPCGWGTSGARRATDRSAGSGDAACCQRPTETTHSACRSTDSTTESSSLPARRSAYSCPHDIRGPSVFLDFHRMATAPDRGASQQT